MSIREGSDHVHRLARLLDTLRRVGAKARRDLAPRPGSPATGEMQAHPALHDDLVNVLSTVSQLLFTAEEHLGMVGKALIDEYGFASPVYTNSRTALETAARAGRLLEADIDAETRATRMVTARIESIDEAVQMMKGFPSGERTEERRKQVLAETRERGLDPPPRGPGGTKLAKWRLEGEAGHELGRIAYQLASAVEHGSTHGLQRQLRLPAQEPSEEWKTLPGTRLHQYSVTNDDLYSSLVPATTAYMLSAADLLRYVGLERKAWLGLCIRTNRSARGIPDAPLT